jgi:hypothetical protein
MKFWGSRKKRPTATEDAVTAARLVDLWLRSMEPGAEAEPARRWQQSGRLDPGDARRFAAWQRERVRLYLLTATADEGPSAPRTPPGDFEGVRAEILSAAEDTLALGRWLKAEGYE